MEQPILEDNYFNRFIVFRYNNEYVKIPINSIVYCKADGCYTSIIIDTGTEYFICKTLVYLEDYLKAFNFIRCHHSFLVNGAKIEKYCPNTKTLMANGQSIPVSRRKGRGIQTIF